jgi:hypothetical protein
MFCARCGRDLGEKQDCTQCGWSVDEIDMPLGTPLPARTGNGHAIASLVCGVVSLYTCGGGFALPIIGLVLGILGLKSEQSGIAAAGIILNAVILVLFVLAVVLLGAMWLMSPAAPAAVPAGRCC